MEPKRMRTVGVLGGMSWESTLIAYRFLNTMARDRFGPLHSFPLIIHSFDFARIESLQAQGAWDELSNELADAACGLKTAGSEALMICTNTMHRCAEEIHRRSGLEILHIADATGSKIVERGFGKNGKKVGLLGTRYTMQADFYKKRLEDKWGLSVVVPSTESGDLLEVHRIIYEELCAGIVKEESKQFYVDVVGRMVEKESIECLILGCTEIMLLISEDKDVGLPVFDTTRLHAEYVLDWAVL